MGAGLSKVQPKWEYRGTVGDVGPLFDWYRTTRILWQAHNDLTVTYRYKNLIFTLIVVVLNSLSVLVSQWPSTSTEDGCEEVAVPVEEFHDWAMSPFFKELFATVVAVLTIIVTGFARQYDPQTKAEQHSQSSKGFRRLMLRFEDLINRELPYTNPYTERRHLANTYTQGESDMYMMGTPLGASVTLATPGSPGSVASKPGEAIIRGHAHAKHVEWDDWFKDYQKVIDDAPE